jgi:hypothetical protein
MKNKDMINAMQPTYIPVRVKIKNFLKNHAPKKLFTVIQAGWRKTLAPLFSGSGLIETYTALYLSKNPKIIQSGPFANMKYINDSAGSAYLLKLIGSYEAVLNPKIELLKKADLDTIIDIGCAEGYYLVGLGIHNPKARLIGYDIDARALTLTKQLYTANNLQNKLDLIPSCTADSLQSDITDNTALICDAEGFEDKILNIQATPRLAHVKYLLLETHEQVVPHIVQKIEDMFAPTHTIEIIHFKNANAAEYPFLKDLDPKISYELLRERGDQDQRWMFLTRR